MKYLRIIFAVLFSSLLLWSCKAQPKSQLPWGNDEEYPLPPQEEYSLEQKDEAYWQIQHDSDYYSYFNEIHESYYKLIRETQDPEEIRRLYMERDLKIAQRRQQNLADADLVKEVVGGTSAVQGTNPTGHLFRMNDVGRIPHQRFSPSDPANYQYEKVEFAGMSKVADSMTAIIQFDRQLKERGINLIVVPVPNSSQLYAHRLEKKIKLEEVVWHPWAYMISGLLENDVEVLDLLDLYKTYSGDNTTLNYIDHHWGQAGLDIAGWELAQRLKRYHFDDYPYLDPQFLTKEPITVTTPALIPHWDDITVSYIKEHMPYSPVYERDQILYKGEHINETPSFEDTPVLIMGDSFIPHAADSSAGIYAHLAYYSGIIPAAFSRDAGAAEPPEFFRKNVAGQGREPKVVIWEIYGSAMGEITHLNDWRVVKITEPPRDVYTVQETENTAAGAFWVQGEVLGVSPIPSSTDSMDYPDALYAYNLKILEGGDSGLAAGETVLIYSQFMEGFQKLDENIVVPGDTGRFKLEAWSSAVKNVEKIGTMQLIDDLEDYLSDIYFVHQVE